MQNTVKDIFINDNDIVAMPASYRNFAGDPDKYNPNGCMGNFWLFLTDDKAHELEAQGLNIRWKENRDGDMEGRLQVFVRFEFVPPKIFLKSGTKVTEITKETVRGLNHDEFSSASIIINPYRYVVNGREGVKAYLKKGYFTLCEDPYEQAFLGEYPKDE